MDTDEKSNQTQKKLMRILYTLRNHLHLISRTRTIRWPFIQHLVKAIISPIKICYGSESSF
jgi:hypothetical protein